MQNKIASFTPSKSGTRELKPRTRRLKDIVKLLPCGLTLRQAILNGFAYQVAVDIAKYVRLDIKSFAEIVDIKPATLNRRAKDGVFTSQESDRIYNFVEVFDAALALFEGRQDEVINWLNTPARGLGNEIPMSLLKISTGASDVITLLRRIDTGVLI